MEIPGSVDGPVSEGAVAGESQWSRSKCCGVVEMVTDQSCGEVVSSWFNIDCGVLIRRVMGLATYLSFCLLALCLSS